MLGPLGSEEGHTPLTAHWLHTPALDSLLGRHVNLLRHVPKGAVNV